MNHYGVDNPSKIESVKNKRKNTIFDKYGVEYASQSTEIQQKINSTKRKNQSFNTSHVEVQFKQYLIDNNYDFIYQYKSELYPFNCDFYIPKYDLYIEINAYWVHGGHAFNGNDEHDINQLNKWKNKSITNKQYNTAIKTWTIRDPLKLKTAKENNLNYLPIYSNNIDDVIRYFQTYIKNMRFDT